LDLNKDVNNVGFIATASFKYTDEQIEEWKTQPNWESLQNEVSASMLGEMGLSYSEFISPMIKAIQELSSKVTQLELIISGSKI
jgi:hypothetical protein